MFPKHKFVLNEASCYCPQAYWRLRRGVRGNLGDLHCQSKVTLEGVQNIRLTFFNIRLVYPRSIWEHFDTILDHLGIISIVKNATHQQMIASTVSHSLNNSFKAYHHVGCQRSVNLAVRCCCRTQAPHGDEIV